MTATSRHSHIVEALAAEMRTATGSAAGYIITAAIELDMDGEACDVTALERIIRESGINGGDPRAMAAEAIRIIGSL